MSESEEGNVVEEESAVPQAPAPEKKTSPTEPLPWSPALVAVAVVVVAATWGLSWYFAGGKVWTGWMILGGIILAASLWEKMWKACMVLAVALAGSLMLGLLFPVSRVYVENFSGKEVRIQKDAKDWLALANGGTEVVRIRGGGHVIAVFSADGKKLRETNVDVPARRSADYVFNVLGAGTYYEGDVSYGDTSYRFGSGPSERKITEEWFETEVDYLLEKPPDSVRVSGSGSGTLSKRYLRRESQKWEGGREED